MPSASGGARRRLPDAARPAHDDDLPIRQELLDVHGIRLFACRATGSFMHVAEPSVDGFGQHAQGQQAKGLLEQHR